MKITPFCATYANFQHIPSPDDFCESAKFQFNEYVQAGVMGQFPRMALYIYQIESRQHRRHTGLVALNDITDFLAGQVKMHENTLREKEEQQMKLFLRWNAVLKPILLTHSPVAALGAWLQIFADQHKPLFTARFAKSGQVHRVWTVEEPTDIAYLQQLYAEQVPNVYIADGHHRTTTIALLHDRYSLQPDHYDFDHLFCAFFATDQLDILDYNRVVEAPAELHPLHLMVQLSKLFDLERLPGPEKPTRKHEITLLLHREWYRLRWRKEALEQASEQAVVLDASLLNELVLRNLLGITDVRTDHRITYIDGSKGFGGVQKAVKHGTNCLGFMLYPVSFDDLRQLADAGASLPPKSTYFEPRLRSGVLVQSLVKGN